MRLSVKTLIINMCLIFNVQAETRLYQYNGDLPFVEMMLSMMTEMGMIDRIPEYLVNHGYYDYLNLPGQGVTQPGINLPPGYRGGYQGSYLGPYQSRYPGNITYQQRGYQNCQDERCERNRLSSLDGVWVTQHGEILGVKEGRFLWSDGKTRYLTGTFNRKENEFALKVDQSEYVMAYQYAINGNRLQTRDNNGVIRRFVRAPYNQ